MRTLLSSPRRRRRILQAAVALLVVGGAVTLGLLYPNTAEEPAEQAAPNRNAAGQVYREPATVSLSREDRAEAMRTALKFVNTAVARRRAEESYDLVIPELRQGMSREEWGKGEIPVQPYPATEVQAAIDYSYRNEIGLRVLLRPPTTSELRPAIFTMDMQAAGSGDNRRWLVSSWAPTAAGMPNDAARGGRSSGSGIPNLSRDPGPGRSAPLGAAWLLLPAAIFSLILIVPIGLGIRSWYQNRRAFREYEASRSLR